METEPPKTFRAISSGDGAAFIVLALLVFLLFFDFFAKGHLLDANHDRRESIIPWHLLQQRALQRGEIPQWNPYVQCGVAFMGNGYDLSFYPPLHVIYRLPEQALPFMLTLLMVVNVYLAGLFAYLFFKTITDESFWALTAAVVYLFSSSSIMNITVGNSCFAFLLYLPVWLYLVSTRHRRSFPGNLFWTAVALTLFVATGSWQRVMYTVWFVFLFILFQSFRRVHGRMSFDPVPLITNTLALLTAMAVGAIRFIPFLENSGRGIGAPSSFEAALDYIPFSRAVLLRFFAPEFFGRKLDGSWMLNTVNVNHFEGFTCYVGLAAGFVFLYVLLRQWNHKTLFWNVAALSILLVVLVPPFTYIHYLLARKSILIFTRLAWFLPICAAAATGIFGAFQLDEALRSRRLFRFSLVCTAAAAGALLLTYVHFSGKYTLHPSQTHAMATAMVHFAAVSCAFLLALYFLRPETLKFVFLLIVVCDLMVVARIDGSNSRPFLSPPEAFARGEAAGRQCAAVFDGFQRRYRILTDRDPRLSVNRAINHGFYTSSGNDSFCSPLIARIYQGRYALTRLRSDYAQSSPRNQRALALSSSMLISTTEGVKRMEIPSMVPRVSLYSDYRVVPDDREAFDRVMDPAFDPSRTLVVDRPPTLVVTEPGEGAAAVIVEESHQHVLVATRSPANAILLLTDTFSDGWSVAVDEVPSVIARGNYAFRAVTVPAGKHIVKFMYEHPAYRTSRRFSMAGLAALGLTAIFFLVQVLYTNRSR